MLAPQAERLDTLPTGRQLSYGAYHDQARALRRVLKQVGAGSLEAGLAAVRADEAALREVSAVISLDPKARPGAAAWLLCYYSLTHAQAGLRGLDGRR